MLPCSVPAPGGRRIADGDLVIAYENYDSMKGIYVDAAKGQLSNRHGNFLHKDWVGKVCSFRSDVLVILSAPFHCWLQVLSGSNAVLKLGGCHQNVIPPRAGFWDQGILHVRYWLRPSASSHPRAMDASPEAPHTNSLCR